MSKTAFVLLFISISFTQVIGQCTVHGVDGGDQNYAYAPGVRHGQTFVPCENGHVTSIDFTLAGYTGHLGTYNFYIGTSTGGLLPTLAQTFNVVSSLQHTVTIYLTNPFAVNEGTIYEFQFVHTDPAVMPRPRRQMIGDYLEGNRTADGMNVNTADMDFGVCINKFPPPVPTLGEWGLICLSLLIVIFGALVLNNRQIFLVKIE